MRESLRLYVLTRHHLRMDSAVLSFIGSGTTCLLLNGSTAEWH